MCNDEREKLQGQLDYLANLFFMLTGEEICENPSCRMDSGCEELVKMWRRLHRKLEAGDKPKKKKKKHGKKGKK